MGKLYLLRVKKPSGIENIAVLSKLSIEGLENEKDDCISREYPEFNIKDEFIIYKSILDNVDDSVFEYDNLSNDFNQNNNIKIFRIEDCFILSVDEYELILGCFSEKSIIDGIDFNKVYFVY
jgi:hypothetical protein